MIYVWKILRVKLLKDSLNFEGMKSAPCVNEFKNNATAHRLHKTRSRLNILADVTKLIMWDETLVMNETPYMSLGDQTQPYT